MSTRPYEYNLPETAVCPGCDTMVVLPVVVAVQGVCQFQYVPAEHGGTLSIAVGKTPR